MVPASVISTVPTVTPVADDVNCAPTYSVPRSGGSGGVELSNSIFKDQSTVILWKIEPYLLRLAQIKTVVKGLSGSVYPLVIDSPFGSLSAFREGIARNITELAPQVIIFVSPKQYDSDVERALKDSQRIGKQYYLRYNGEKLPDGAHTNLVINDQQLKQYAKIDKGEFTEIVELGI